MARRGGDDGLAGFLLALLGVGGLAWVLNRQQDDGGSGTSPAPTPTPAPKSEPDKLSLLDSNGVAWGLYKYKDGRWEGTVVDTEAAPAYFRTFDATSYEGVKSLIDAYASTNAAALSTSA